MRGGSYFFMLLVIALNLFGILHIMLGLSQKFFVDQALFAFLLVIASFVMFVLIANNKEAAWLFSALLFILLLVNVVYLHFVVNSRILNILLLFDAITFLITVTLLREGGQEVVIIPNMPRKSNELKRELGLNEANAEEQKIIIEEIKPQKKAVYIAGKNSKLYHASSCSYAKNLKSKIFLRDKGEARRKKLKPHRCVKKQGKI
ncbi:hypothetical protein D6745_05670 [Candidatus Woesearchaeota archaeon]|nr:MAG: hypothetical protein D6745_05670 [Candidatus Woesearchaeota archaeon]